MLQIQLIDIESSLYPLSLKLRNEILRQPLGMSLYEEDLSDEVNQAHFVAVQNENVVGIVVLKIEKNIGKLRQMAVQEELRGQHIGQKLVKALEEHAKSIGLTKIVLHARYHAVGFYEKMNYARTPEPSFIEVSMEHFEMEKVI